MVYAHTSHTHNAEGRRICWAQEFATILDNTVRPPSKKEGVEGEREQKQNVNKETTVSKWKNSRK